MTRKNTEVQGRYEKEIKAQCDKIDSLKADQARWEKRMKDTQEQYEGKLKTRRDEQKWLRAEIDREHERREGELKKPKQEFHQMQLRIEGKQHENHLSANRVQLQAYERKLSEDREQSRRDNWSAKLREWEFQYVQGVHNEKNRKNRSQDRIGIVFQ
ncbi:uncharacterized protein BJX67DRAFT_383109 [Aspergillus lucknowensis]|uniref:Uncharacterized protein n=1 Tax=Aspergillus lucknowensis TaxID=176173 RepID=A0ABR4LKS5_9EURO